MERLLLKLIDLKQQHQTKHFRHLVATTLHSLYFKPCTYKLQCLKKMDEKEKWKKLSIIHLNAFFYYKTIFQDSLSTT